MSCQYKDKVIDYLRGNIDDRNIEEHIENCKECNAMIEGYMEKEKEIEFLDIECNIKDKILTEHVINYKAGRRRIIIFIIIGLILGFFSYNYRSDDFIVTRIIISIPYKLGEIIHNLFHTHPYLYTLETSQYAYNEFFPQALFVSLLAERITPILFGGLIYGSLAYFTGDKRIFTLRRYLKFAGIWASIILVFTGGTLILNTFAIKENNNLDNITGFLLSSETCATGYYKESGEKSDEFEKLYSRLYKNDEKPKLVDNIERNCDDEYILELYFGKYHERYMICYVNVEKHYLVTDKNLIYDIPQEFAQSVKDYYDNNLEDVEVEK